MRYVRVLNRPRQVVLGTRIGVADRWWQRLRGLLGRPPLRPGEGLLLQRCQAVHLFGMTYPLDIAFLDRSGTVVAAYRSLPPGHHTGWHHGAANVLELPAGTLEDSGTVAGDALVWGAEGPA